jgi:hypothetical protein
MLRDVAAGDLWLAEVEIVHALEGAVERVLTGGGAGDT